MKKQFNGEDEDRPERLVQIFNDLLSESKLSDTQNIALLSILIMGVPLFIFAPVVRLYAGLAVMGVLVFYIIHLLKKMDWVAKNIEGAAEKFRDRQEDLESNLRTTRVKHLQPLQQAYQEIESKYNTLEIEHKKLQEEFEKFRSRIREGEKSE